MPYYLVNKNNSTVNIENNFDNNLDVNKLKNSVTTDIKTNNFNSNDKDITLYFEFSNGKELYLNVKETDYLMK